MAGILKKGKQVQVTSRKAAAPPASPSSGSPSEDEFMDDSEEDEWEAERGRAGPSGSRAFEQDDEDGAEFGGEYGSEEEEDGVAAYESDQGEMIEDDDEEEALGKQLSAIPFTSLLKAQKQLNKGKQAQGKGKGRADDDEDEDGRAGGPRGKAKLGKGKGRHDMGGRSNKHAPTEMSTKKPVSRARQIVESTSIKARDPRFDALSGSVRSDLFQRSYSFLADQQKSELEAMRKTAAAARKNRLLPQEEKDRIEEALKRMENREVSRRNKEREAEALRKWKKEEQEKRKDGKKEFYLKNAEKKKLFLKAKFDELSQDKRKLSKAMDKKRRKTSQKEKKLMPNLRPGAGGY
ncbi:hypothetical protein JCM5296_001497 [Sporobolomyces johnsonii]